MPRLLCYLIGLISFNQPVVVEYLKAVDIEDTNDGVAALLDNVLRHLHAPVHLSHDPREQAVIDRLSSKVMIHINKKS